MPEFKGLKFPTFHNHKRGISKAGARPAEIGRACQLIFSTDAENDYFERVIDPAYYSVRIDGFRPNIDFQTQTTLWEGIHSFKIDLPKTAKVGEILKIEIQVSDVSRSIPFSHEAEVIMIPKIDHKKSVKKKKKSAHPSNQPGQGSTGSGNLGLPNITPVSAGDWAQYGFDKYSAMTVKQDGDNYDFFYNKDNQYLLHEQKLAIEKVELYENQFSAGLTLMVMGVLNNKNIPGEERKETIETLSRSIAPILLPMINQLGRIEAT